MVGIGRAAFSEPASVRGKRTPDEPRGKPASLSDFFISHPLRHDEEEGGESDVAFKLATCAATFRPIVRSAAT